MMDIYKYPNIEGVYIIKENNKLYNVLDSEHYDSNSFLKGGIILNSGKKTNKTSFPHNLMMDGLEDYKYNETSNGRIYDKNVWSESDIQNFNIPNEINVLQQKNIAMNIQLMEDVIKEVDNIKNLFKKDDNTLKSQWFMDYVVFDEESPPSVLDSFRNREYKINKSIQKLNELSQSFEINNNHQMKLWFKIFFDLDDTSVTDKNMNLKEEFKEHITVRTNQLNKQLKDAETKMEAKEEAKTENAEAKEETHTSNNAPAAEAPATEAPAAEEAKANAVEGNAEEGNEVEAANAEEGNAVEAPAAEAPATEAPAAAEANAAQAEEAAEYLKILAATLTAEEAAEYLKILAATLTAEEAAEYLKILAATRALEAPATVNNVEKILKEAKHRSKSKRTSNIEQRRKSIRRK